MNVGDIMTQEVISVRPDTDVVDAAKLIITERISGLPVINDAHVLVGMVTEGDLLRRIETGTEKSRPHWLEFLIGANALADEYVRTHGRKVADVMTTDVEVATEDMSLANAVDLMECRRIKRLPVLRAGRVVGIVARANLLRALAAKGTKPATQAADTAIRQEIEKELEKRAWNGRQNHVVVNDGVVDLWGFFTDEKHRKAIHVAVQNVSGVRQVRDHLMWLEPHIGVVLDTGLDGRRGILRP